ncbi:MAG: hypothetical protein SFU98_07275, partial [Leptospiraceae bacterium]|nr:hypothetical protein [Leptospiraceae bacterium]
MALELTSWDGDIDSGELENETGLYLSVVNNVVYLIHEESDLSIPLVDLFQNPFKPVALLDPETGKILPSQMPSIVLGQTFVVDTKDQMLELSSAVKGAVAIIKGIPGGASYRLLGDNYYNIDHWQQLLSRFQNWSEVLNKPETFPP